MAKTSIRYIGLVLLAVLIGAVLFARTPYIANATELGSDNTTSATDGSQQSSSNASDNGSSGNSALSNYMRNYNPITDKDMQKASNFANPIVSALGTLAGFILIVVIAAIAVVTALDLCYIMIPITRSFLGGTPAQQGGMGGGYGMGGYGMRGGMGMNTGTGAMRGHKWVSDEAVQAVQASGVGAGTPQGNMGMGGMGMGMGMGMAGGMGMQQQASSPKTVLGTYFKKRLFVIILFAVACIVLTSSALTNCGINIGLLILKVVNKLGGAVSTVQLG